MFEDILRLRGGRRRPSSFNRLTVDSADPDWTARLRAVAHRFRALALAHPNVVPLLVTRPLATHWPCAPGYASSPRSHPHPAPPRRLQRPNALPIYRALFRLLNGPVLDELQELVDDPDETDDLLRLGLHRLPIGEFLLQRSLATHGGTAALECGLHILLTGLTTALTPHP
ncbi:hypothetical protein AB0442_37945 [Kitasatospora sp. NPDC085895]|uniref:hypothetical protein n=1 Tax=Kitasatospora sp. NPDC085895 TaxID=3155057 RepID=UPI00344B1122